MNDIYLGFYKEETSFREHIHSRRRLKRRLHILCWALAQPRLNDDSVVRGFSCGGCHHVQGYPVRAVYSLRQHCIFSTSHVAVMAQQRLSMEY